MGWGRTLLLGDIGNRLDIEDTEQDISRLRSQLSGAMQKDRSQDKLIEELISENAEMKIYLASIVRLLVSKGILTEEELTSFVDRVDGEDRA